MSIPLFLPLLVLYLDGKKVEEEKEMLYVQVWNSCLMNPSTQ